jgi:hypothetical protein
VLIKMHGSRSRRLLLNQSSSGAAVAGSRCLFRFSRSNLLERTVFSFGRTNK